MSIFSDFRIFFYSSMTNQFDDLDSQFLKVPTNSSAMSQKLRMSFFMSTPFQGQTTVLNSTYVIKDTVIMRIDCEVFNTEYIGHESDQNSTSVDSDLDNL